jgi:hypothetical protein
MSSRLQGAWMIFTARDRKPKRGMNPESRRTWEVSNH